MKYTLIFNKALHIFKIKKGDAKVFFVLFNYSIIRINCKRI